MQALRLPASAGRAAAQQNTRHYGDLMTRSCYAFGTSLPRLTMALMLVLAALTPGRQTAAYPSPGPIEGAAPQPCESESTIVVQGDASEPAAVTSEPCTSAPAASVDADRAYLVETATPGTTMVRQGPGVAIGRLNPEFVGRLAAAVREARAAGLTSVGIFSAYRPPAFGVGGFADKFESLHTYGLAVDMTGIGGPGSADAKLWYEIADRHGVVCPYGFDSRTEWNHCQPTRVKIIGPENPLRETVTASGPIDLEGMFDAGTALIARSAAMAGRSLDGLGAVEHSPLERRHDALTAETSHRHGIGLVRLAKLTRSEEESRKACGRHLHHAGENECESSRREASARRQIAHLGHAATGNRETRRI